MNFLLLSCIFVVKMYLVIGMYHDLVLVREYYQINHHPEEMRCQLDKRDDLVLAKPFFFLELPLQGSYYLLQ
jgi:hypothetical protein